MTVLFGGGDCNKYMSIIQKAPYEVKSKSGRITETLNLGCHILFSALDIQFFVGYHCRYISDHVFPMC